MNPRPPYPPFEVVNLQPLGYAGNPGARIDVVLSPEASGAVERIAVHLVERYARDNFTVWLYFYPAHPTADRRSQRPAFRARYVRDDIPRHPGSMRVSRGRRTVDIRLMRGLLTVETMQTMEPEEPEDDEGEP